MRRRDYLFRIIALLACLSIIAVAPGVAQPSAAQDSSRPSKPKHDPRTEEWTPASLPADALSYGAALEQNAPPKLKKWCEHYAQSEMPKQKIDPRATMAVVDREFASASDEARDAAIFLLDYLAYKHQDNEQRMLAARIRRMDDEAYDITERMFDLKESQQRRMRSTNSKTAMSPQQLIQTEDELQQLEQRLRALSTDRKVKIDQLLMLRRRVDGYLKVMSVTHPRMNGVAPEVLRTMP